LWQNFPLSSTPVRVLTYNGSCRYNYGSNHARTNIFSCFPRFDLKHRKSYFGAPNFFFFCLIRGLTLRCLISAVGIYILWTPSFAIPPPCFPSFLRTCVCTNPRPSIHWNQTVCRFKSKNPSLFPFFRSHCKNYSAVEGAFRKFRYVIIVFGSIPLRSPLPVMLAFPPPFAPVPFGPGCKNNRFSGPTLTGLMAFSVLLGGSLVNFLLSPPPQASSSLSCIPVQWLLTFFFLGGDSFLGFVVSRYFCGATFLIVTALPLDFPLSRKKCFPWSTVARML